jgi:DNA-binding response OmpR family regulator
MRRILVVEDEEVLREMYEQILSNQPYLIDVADNGEAALHLCQKHVYDLILLDIMMPVMDGVAFMKEFEPVAPSKTRIIIMTNLSSGYEIEAASDLGAHRTEIKANLSGKELVAVVRYELEAF